MKIKLNNFKYGTFGLRKDWIKLFFDKDLTAILDSNLGPRQKDTPYYYLKDLNLIANKSLLTESSFMLKTLYEKLGIDSLTLWGFWGLIFTFKYVNEKLIVSLDEEKNNLDVIKLVLKRR